MAGFPFPLVTVPGDQALATWRRLKREGRGSPVIIGDDEQVARLAEAFEYNGQTVEQILMAAAGLRMPQALADRRAKDEAETEAWLRANPDAPKPTVTIVDESGKERVLSGAEIAEMDAAAARGPELGEWPAEGEATELTDGGYPLLVYSYETGKPLPRVHIALIPTSDPTEIPAYLRYGGWNDCPPAEYHVAFLRDQRDRYGMELVAAGFDTLEFEAARAPQTREEAIGLAREIYLYCSDTIDQGFETVSALAHSLMISRWRFIWWD